MSGGSYNYLCWTDELAELLTKQHTLREMADRLAGLGYAADAAAETEELLVMLRQWHIRAEVRVKRLEGIWKAIEWWDSSDWGEESVRKALTAYRGEDCQHHDTWTSSNGHQHCNGCGQKWNPTEAGDTK